MTFKDPWILFLIPFVLAIVYILCKRQKATTFRFSDTHLFSDLAPSWKIKFRHFPFVLRLIVLSLFLCALAGPRSILEETVYKTEGIDIMLTIDASGSMAAEDFIEHGQRINRLGIVKKVVEEFIEDRPYDRLGLVAFAGLAYTVCPLTGDHDWLKKNLERIELGLIEDGTAVGSAIISSLARLKDSDAKSKVMILLTDGMNNAGEIDPMVAARAAQALDVKIYTIGAGTKGYVPFPVTDIFGRRVYQQVFIDMDEGTLQQIAQITGGRYFRVTDTASLRQVYQEIDALEKTEIEQLGYFEYEELFDKLLVVALGILLVEILLANTVLLKIP